MTNPLDIKNAIALLKGEGYEIKEPTKEEDKTFYRDIGMMMCTGFGEVAKIILEAKARKKVSAMLAEKQATLPLEQVPVQESKERYIPQPKDYVTMNGIVANVQTVFHYKRTVGVAYWDGKEMIRDEWHFDAIEPLKTAPTPTEEQTITDKPILFTTEDGYPITSEYGDNGIWRVFIEPHSYEMWKPYNLGLPVPPYPNGEKYFFYEKNAEQYIIDNKPCLSLNDINHIILHITKDGMDYLRRKVKEKLNQKQI